MSTGSSWFYFRPKQHTPVLWRNHVGNEKNPSCPSSSLTVPYVLWGFMMIYMDTIIVPFCCRTANELTLKKSTNHPIPAMTHLPKCCPTKKKTLRIHHFGTKFIEFHIPWNLFFLPPGEIARAESWFLAGHSIPPCKNESQKNMSASHSPKNLSCTCLDKSPRFKECP